jgi:hypothetical protein
VAGDLAALDSSASFRSGSLSARCSGRNGPAECIFRPILFSGSLTSLLPEFPECASVGVSVAGFDGAGISASCVSMPRPEIGLFKENLRLPLGILLDCTKENG